jgi:hypothetical protein
MTPAETRLWSGLCADVDALVAATPEQPLASLPRWDSLAVLLVLTHAEQQHGRTLTGAQVRACRTGRDLLTLLSS